MLIRLAFDMPIKGEYNQIFIKATAAFMSDRFLTLVIDIFDIMTSTVTHQFVY
jgi:hypothetical protein